MQRSFQDIDSPSYLPLTLAAVQVILIGGIIWQLNRNPFQLWEPQARAGEVALQIGRSEADAIATAHTPGKVVDTDVIRDNGMISYLITVAPEQSNGDAAVRRLLFIDPDGRRVWRDEGWSSKARQPARISRQLAETAALKQTGTGGRVKSTELQHYEGRDVWQVKTGKEAAPSWLVTIDAGSGEVLRGFELLRDY